MKAPELRPGRRARAAIIVVGVALLGAACQSTAATSTSTPSTTRPPHKKISYVTIDNRQVRIPTEIHGQAPDLVAGASQAGQQILITPSGIHPSLLLATQGIPVVWTNLTDRPQRVIFTNSPGQSEIIPPAGTFSIPTPRSQSYTFRTSGGLAGVLNVDPNVPGLP